MSLRVLHIITGLNPGGAEGMLFRLLSKLQRMDVHSEVVSLSDIGAVGQRIMDLRLRVHAIRLNRVAGMITLVPRMLRVIRSFSPTIIQTWMPHADLVGGVLGTLASDAPVVWNIRMSNTERERKRTRILAETINRLLSAHLPAAIVCCGEETLTHYAALGYSRAKMLVIPNGFDLEVFRPDAQLRDKTRRSLGVDDEQLLVGIVGRFHPMKDHLNFIRAAGSVRSCIPNVRFMLVGAGLDGRNKQLQGWLRDAGILGASICLGLRDDLPALYSAMDINVLSSISGEGFPNVLGEAMACGVPCISTDVGDARLIVSNPRQVVSPGNPVALADAIVRTLQLPHRVRQELGKNAREAISAKFSISVVAEKYVALYHSVASRRGAIGGG